MIYRRCSLANFTACPPLNFVWHRLLYEYSLSSKHLNNVSPILLCLNWITNRPFRTGGRICIFAFWDNWNKDPPQRMFAAMIKLIVWVYISSHCKVYRDTVLASKIINHTKNAFFQMLLYHHSQRFRTIIISRNFPGRRMYNFWVGESLWWTQD